MYEQGILTVNYSNRQIIIPNNIAVAGVRDDELSEVLVFLVDRYYDDVDLYQIPVYVDFMNALGETDFDAIIIGVEPVGEDQLQIKWRISSKTTRYAGMIRFALRFERIETIDNVPKVTFCWKTTPVSIKIADKLEVFGDIPEEQIDEERIIIASFAQQLTEHTHDSDVHLSENDRRAIAFTGRRYAKCNEAATSYKFFADFPDATRSGQGEIIHVCFVNGINTTVYDNVVLSATYSTGYISGWIIYHNNVLNVDIPPNTICTFICIENNDSEYEYDYEWHLIGMDVPVTGSGIPEAPIDGEQYARQNGAWSVVEGGSGEGHAVKYTPQILTEPQKAQARQNIGVTSEITDGITGDKYKLGVDNGKLYMVISD